MRKLWYVGLEPYEQRYTKQLTQWNESEFKRLDINYEVVRGIPLTNTIEVGQVLDAYGRPYWALSQIMQLIEHLRAHQITNDDWILFEDMYHPGIEALPYIFAQTKIRPRIAMRCLAQTVDPDDFVYYTGMSSWMRKYEQMVNEFVDLILCASEEMVPFMTTAGWEVPVAVTGLPYDSLSVSQYVSGKAFSHRKEYIAFTSRLADEKQIRFLAKTIEKLFKKNDTAKLILMSPNLPAADEGILALYRQYFSGIQENRLSFLNTKNKADYYYHLSRCRVLFNCSLQDWISYTALEADTLRCNLVFPAYRSFPESLENDRSRLYIPWSVDDAVDKLQTALLGEQRNIGRLSIRQDQSIGKTLTAINNWDPKGSYDKTYGTSINPQVTLYRKNIARKAIA